ncbi:MAG: primosomal protein N', partial [Cyanobacteria bacterium P01_F01_bin.42]
MTGSQSNQYVEVLVDCPGQQPIYSYRVPKDLEVAPGDILSVPFGPQQVGAIALRLMDTLPDDVPANRVRPIENIASASLFPRGYWSLLEKVATYYHTSLIATIRTVLPPGLLRRSQRRVKIIATPSETEFHQMKLTAQQIYHLLLSSKGQDYTWTYIKQKVKGAQPGLRQLQQQRWVQVYFQSKATAKPKTKRVVTLISQDHAKTTPRQEEILAFLKKRGGELWMKDLLGLTHASASTVQTLAKKGLVAISDRETLRLESSDIQPDQPRELTADQTNALARIQDQTGYAQMLLHGVTGSGKTEVYLQAIAPVLQRGQSVLLLVPEIGLTPQMSDRVRARFGDRVRVYHSALSDGERYDTWRSLLDADAQIVIGTRSAIFAPLKNLGLIILDEEHDNGYKQESPAPCYHTRTVARWRAEQESCPLVLGSATPSLETWISTPAEQYLHLPQRVLGQAMPPITLIDMREELQQGNRSVFSRQIQQRLMQLKETNQQGLLFINRRGHSTFVSCRSCGYVVECPNCSVSLTYHQTHSQSQPILRCHYCNHTARQPEKCPSCGSPYFKFFGSGTQRVMEELRDNLPDLRVIRFDSDTTRRKGAHRDLLTQFAMGEADVMVGTQMLTKGIDIPQVQFVGVLAADSLLN